MQALPYIVITLPTSAEEWISSTGIAAKAGRRKEVSQVRLATCLREEHTHAHRTKNAASDGTNYNYDDITRPRKKRVIKSKLRKAT